MIRNTAIAVCVLLLTLTTTGCNTRGDKFPDNSILVSVSDDNRITVDGKRIELSRLAGKLKSMGVKADTCIKISVPKDRPTLIMSEISRNLASAGFRKVIFVGTTHADSFLEGTQAQPANPSVVPR